MTIHQLIIEKCVAFDGREAIFIIFKVSFLPTGSQLSVILKSQRWLFIEFSTWCSHKKKLLDKNNFSAGYWQRKVRKMASFVDVDVVFINKIATPSDFETEFLISFSYWKINWIKQPIIWSSKELTNVGRWVMIFFSRYFTVPFAVINFWFFENSWIFQGLS